uniref:NME/NM23 family member 7 n=1 Tax=Amazona collaria TaxID=241587 RepID=A0A8B9FN12_9PSIT
MTLSPSANRWASHSGGASVAKGSSRRGRRSGVRRDPSAAAAMSQDDRFAFTAEWYDPNASLFRRYELLYYPKDGSVEMYDVKNHRTFLKRTKYESLHLEDLFVGNKITVFSRHLTLVDYGDQYTARKLGSRKEKSLALIKPDAVHKIGELIDIIINAGFTITKAKMMVLSRKEAADFYVDHQSKPFYNELLQFITSGPIVAMEILGDDAVCKWKTLLGPANSAAAQTDAPESIRGSFGHTGLRNAAHGPDSVASAAQLTEWDKVFEACSILSAEECRK